MIAAETPGMPVFARIVSRRAWSRVATEGSRVSAGGGALVGGADGSAVGGWGAADWLADGLDGSLDVGVATTPLGDPSPLGPGRPAEAAPSSEAAGRCDGAGLAAPTAGPALPSW